MFHTELREVFSVMNYRRDKRRLYEILLQELSYRALDAETLKVLSIILNAPKLWSERDKYINKNENRVLVRGSAKASVRAFIREQQTRPVPLY